MEDRTLRDEASLQWAFLDDEEDPCMVLSERMECVYVNGAARTLVPEEWFGKRCFEVLPTVDETVPFTVPRWTPSTTLWTRSKWSTVKR